MSEGKQKNKREYKGKSYIDFPQEYCVVDIETTGFSPATDNIIEIGALKFSNGGIIDKFQSLVKPSVDGCEEFVPQFITNLTGITNEMLESAPATKDVLKSFDDFLGKSIIIGYNVSFDINFLYDGYMSYLQKPLSNDFIDALRMARRLYPHVISHRLSDMVEFLEITNEHPHRVLGDCMATAMCYEKFREEALRQYPSIEAFKVAFERSKRVKDLCIEDIEENCRATASNAGYCFEKPLSGRYCVFTGKLEKFVRREAMQIVAHLGGINQNEVTRYTNFLILGNNDYCASIKGGKSAKQKKAEKYKLEGHDIEIMPETVFYDMIQEELGTEEFLGMLKDGMASIAKNEGGR